MPPSVSCPTPADALKVVFRQPLSFGQAAVGSWYTVALISSNPGACMVRQAPVYPRIQIEVLGTDTNAWPFYSYSANQHGAYAPLGVIRSAEVAAEMPDGQHVTLGCRPGEAARVRKFFDSLRSLARHPRMA